MEQSLKIVLDMKLVRIPGDDFLSVLGHPNLFAGLCRRFALAKADFGFTKFANDLLRTVNLPSHEYPPFATHILPEKMDRSEEGRSPPVP